MDLQKFGRSVRALRHRLGWRQVDLAGRCGTSQAAVSRVERGDLAGVSVGSVEALVVALGGELDVRIRRRGEELDRLLDSVHAAIGESLVRTLTGLGWECAVEVTFWIRGERGAVDLLAWHPPTGRLLVIENKSVVPDLPRMLVRCIGRCGWPVRSRHNVVGESAASAVRLCFRRLRPIGPGLPSSRQP